MPKKVQASLGVVISTPNEIWTSLGVVTHGHIGIDEKQLLT